MPKEIAILTEEEIRLSKSLVSMIDSCFTYGGHKKESYNFERYIKPYEAKMGELLFWLTYNQRCQELEENYTVESGVYTDSEGCSYNSLVKKQ